MTRPFHDAAPPADGPKGQDMVARACKAPACAAPITDKTRSKFCKACRGPNTHVAKPSARFYAEAVS